MSKRDLGYRRRILTDHTKEKKVQPCVPTILVDISMRQGKHRCYRYAVNLILEPEYGLCLAITDYVYGTGQRINLSEERSSPIW